MDKTRARGRSGVTQRARGFASFASSAFFLPLFFPLLRLSPALRWSRDVPTAAFAVLYYVLCVMLTTSWVLLDDAEQSIYLG